MAKKYINSALFGYADGQRYSQPFQSHPFIKEEWPSSDTLREVMGYAPNVDVDGDVVNERSTDFPGSGEPLSIPDNGVATSGYNYTSTDFGLSLAQQALGSLEVVTVGVQFSDTSWNDFVPRNAPASQLENLLLQEGFETDFEGDPYFGKYFFNPPRTRPFPHFGYLPAVFDGLLHQVDSRFAAGGADQNVAPVMRQGLLAPDNGGAPRVILDHRYEIQEMIDPGPAVTIEPIYNYYLDSDPDYESAIGSISEARLPNFYIFELASIIHSEMPVGAYYGAIGSAIGDETPYDTTLQILDGTTNSTPQTEQLVSQGYLHTYVNLAPGLSSAANASYLSLYQDIAVVSADMTAGVLGTVNLTARDDRGTDDTSDDLLAIDNYPFYNKITIPFNQQFNDPVITNQIWNDTNYRIVSALMVILELMIIHELRQPGVTTLPFTAYEGNENSLIAENIPVPVVGYLERIIRAMFAPTPVMSPTDAATLGQDALLILRLINSYDFTWEPAAGVQEGTVYLKEPNSIINRYTSFSPPPLLIDDYYYILNNTTEQRLLDSIAGIARTFEEMYKDGESAPGQTLMYAVEKRVVPAGQATIDINDPNSPAPVQTLYFGRPGAGTAESPGGDIVYYDTQIKYGVRYQYDLKRIELVVGNQYRYTDAQTVTLPEDVAGEGRALGNALGFYDDPGFNSPAENDVRSWVGTRAVEPPIDSPAIFGVAFTYYDPSAPDPDAEPVYKRESQVGYYIYDCSPSLGSDLGDIFTPQEIGNIWDQDWYIKASAVEIEIQTGFGENGNAAGGMLPDLPAASTQTQTQTQTQAQATRIPPGVENDTSEKAQTQAQSTRIPPGAENDTSEKAQTQAQSIRIPPGSETEGR